MEWLFLVSSSAPTGLIQVPVTALHGITQLDFLIGEYFVVDPHYSFISKPPVRQLNKLEKIQDLAARTAVKKVTMYPWLRQVDQLEDALQLIKKFEHQTLAEAFRSS